MTAGEISTAGSARTKDAGRERSPNERPDAPTEEEAKRLDAAATWLAGGFSVVTVVLTAIGATGGALERMLRNHTMQSRWGFGLAAVAIAMAGFSKSFFVSDPTFKRMKRWKLTRGRLRALALFLVGKSPETLQKRLLLLGSTAFALGLFLLTDAAAKTPADDEKPAITATFKTADGPLTLHGTVRAGGLRSSSVIHVIATGLWRDERSGDLTMKRRLYESRSGPDSTGVVNVTLDVPLTSGFDHVAIVAAPQDAVDEAHQCTTEVEAKRLEGCFLVRTPNVPDRPQVAASWDTEKSNPVVKVAVASEGLLRSASVAVVVVAERPKSPNPEIYSAVLAPNAAGVLQQDLTVPVPAGVQSVCVAAMAVDTGGPADSDEIPRCPPSSTPQTTWTRLTVAS